jgi:hypothetical protein
MSRLRIRVTADASAQSNEIHFRFQEASSGPVSTVRLRIITYGVDACCDSNPKCLAWLVNADAEIICFVLIS